MASKKDPVVKHSLPNEAKTKKGPSVAVIEDHQSVRNAMELVLGARGCQVVFHDRAAGALAFVRRHRPDVVIVDLHLENRDAGLELVHELRSQPDTARLPVVVWSSDLDVGNKVARAGLKGVAVLSKFGHASVLLATLDKLATPASVHGAGEPGQPSLCSGGDT